MIDLPVTMRLNGTKTTIRIPIFETLDEALIGMKKDDVLMLVNNSRLHSVKQKLRYLDRANRPEEIKFFNQNGFFKEL